MLRTFICIWYMTLDTFIVGHMITAVTDQRVGIVGNFSAFPPRGKMPNSRMREGTRPLASGA